MLEEETCLGAPFIQPSAALPISLDRSLCVAAHHCCAEPPLLSVAQSSLAEIQCFHGSSTRVKSREVAPVDNACVERVMDPKLLLDIVETLNVRSLEAILPQQIQGRIKEVVQYIFQYLLKLIQAAFPELSDNDLPGIVNQMVAWVMQIRCKNPIGFQMMEGFCGQAHVTKSCRKQGLFAVGLDVVHGDQFDVKTPQGCRRWLTTLFFCADGADQWHGVTCKSFVWLTRYVTKRSIDRPLGNETIGIVQDGNELAVLVTFHVMLGALVRVDPILEQPQTSVLHLLPTVKRVSLLQVRKTITNLGAFGSPTKKPLKLYHVKTWPRHLTRPKPVGKRQQLATKNKSGGYNGDRKMLLFSSAYPIAFGEAVAKYVCEDLEEQQGCVQRSIEDTAVERDKRGQCQGESGEGTHQFSNGFFNNLFKSIREATLVEESKSIMWTKEARTARRQVQRRQERQPSQRDWNLVIEETARANDNSDNNKIPDDCLQSFCAILRARKAKHASVSVRVAHFLDPRVMQHRRSNEITAFKRNDLEDVARKMYPQSAVLIEICSVLDNSAGRERVGRMQPAKWAALYANGTEYPALHPILEVFLRAKGSQSVAERGWSAVDVVCGPRRKRLCPDRQQFLMDGFWWFGYIKPSKQCDLLSFH